MKYLIAGTIPLLCGKGDIPQHRLAGVIGKAHMVKHDITALIGQLLAAGLQGDVYKRQCLNSTSS